MKKANEKGDKVTWFQILFLNYIDWVKLRKILAIITTITTAFKFFDIEYKHTSVKKPKKKKVEKESDQMLKKEEWIEWKL